MGMGMELGIWGCVWAWAWVYGYGYMGMGIWVWVYVYGARGKGVGILEGGTAVHGSARLAFLADVRSSLALLKSTAVNCARRAEMRPDDEAVWRGAAAA